MATISTKIPKGQYEALIKELDKWKGAPLAERMRGLTKTALKVYLAPIKRRAAKHNLTGATQRGYAIRELRNQNNEITAFKIDSNTPQRAFAVVGVPSHNIEADPYIDEVRDLYTGRYVGFIDEQIGKI